MALTLGWLNPSLKIYYSKEDESGTFIHGWLKVEARPQRARGGKWMTCKPVRQHQPCLGDRIFLTPTFAFCLPLLLVVSCRSCRPVGVDDLTKKSKTQ